MLCGYPPFQGRNEDETLSLVQKGDLRFPEREWKFISDNAKNFLRNTIQYDSRKRYSAAEALEDPWMLSIRQDEPEKPIAINVLTNLRDFRLQNKLAQASWMFISSFLSSKEEKAELLKTFKALDTNGDGIISKEELQSGYTKFLGKNNEVEVQSILDSIDVNKSGAIDYSGLLSLSCPYFLEFVMASLNRQTFLTPSKLKEAFQLFEPDPDGKIPFHRLEGLVTGAQISLTEASWKQLLRDLDLEGAKYVQIPNVCLIVCSSILRNSRK